MATLQAVLLVAVLCSVVFADGKGFATPSNLKVHVDPRYARPGGKVHADVEWEYEGSDYAFFKVSWGLIGRYPEVVSTAIKHIRLDNLQYNASYMVQVDAYSRIDGKDIPMSKVNTSFDAVGTLLPPHDVEIEHLSLSSVLLSWKVESPPGSGIKTSDLKFIVEYQSKGQPSTSIVVNNASAELKDLERSTDYTVTITVTHDDWKSASLRSYSFTTRHKDSHAPIKGFCSQEIMNSEINVTAGWDFPSDEPVFCFNVNICSPKCSVIIVPPLYRSHSFLHTCYDDLKVSVSAVYGSGVTSDAVLFDGKTAICQPSPPTSVTIQQKQNDLLLTWSAPESQGGPNVSYEAWLDVDTNKIVTDSLSASLAFPRQDLRSTYDLSLRAFTKNEKGETLKSFPFVVELDYMRPPEPENFYLVKRGGTVLCYRVQPFDESAVDEYRIETRDGNLTTSNTTEICVGGLKPFESNRLYLRACYPRLPDVCSDWVWIDEMTDVAAPSKVRALASARQRDGALLITWEPPYPPAGPIDGYFVNLTVVQSDETEQKLLPGTDRSLRIVSPTNHVDYKIVISAFNKDLTGNLFEGEPESYEFRFDDPTRLTTTGILIMVACCVGVVTVCVVGVYSRRRSRARASDNEMIVSHPSD